MQIHGLHLRQPVMQGKVAIIYPSGSFCDRNSMAYDWQDEALCFEACK